MNPQDIIEDLYLHIDRANNLFTDLECKYHILRVLYLEFEEEAQPIDVTPWSGNCCPLCGGQMIRTGTCETCQQCGESVGGCT